MSGSITVSDAARLLGTSKPTVTALIAKGHLQATRQPRGKLSIWRIDERSVERWLDEHGRYDEQGRGGRSRLAKLEAEVSALREEVRALASADQRTTGVSRMGEEGERDDLRARIVSLEEALARVRLAAELQRTLTRSELWLSADCWRPCRQANGRRAFDAEPSLSWKKRSRRSRVLAMPPRSARFAAERLARRWLPRCSGSAGRADSATGQMQRRHRLFWPQTKFRCPRRCQAWSPSRRHGPRSSPRLPSEA